MRHTRNTWEYKGKHQKKLRNRKEWTEIECKKEGRGGGSLLFVITSENLQTLPEERGERVYFIKLSSEICMADLSSKFNI